jgi:hypothetical protein
MSTRDQDEVREGRFRFSHSVVSRQCLHETRTKSEREDVVSVIVLSLVNVYMRPGLSQRGKISFQSECCLSSMFTRDQDEVRKGRCRFSQSVVSRQCLHETRTKSERKISFQSERCLSSMSTWDQDEVREGRFHSSHSVVSSCCFNVRCFVRCWQSQEKSLRWRMPTKWTRKQYRV